MARPRDGNRAGTPRREVLLGLPARLLLVLLSSALAFASFPPWGYAPLAWVALLPLFAAIVGASPPATRLLGLLWGLLFYGGSLWWFTRIFGPAAVALWGILAFTVWAFALVLERVLRRWGLGAALALAPVLWTGIDLFRCEIWFFRFSWLQLGLSQVTSPQVLQLASVVGVYGLTFLIVASNCGLAWLFLRGRRWVAWASTVGTVAAAALLGLVPVRSPEPAERSVVAGAVQTEMGDPSRLEELIAEAGGRGARLIVCPEYALTEFPLEDPGLLAELASGARGAGAYVVVGCKERVPGRDDERGFYNAALILAPDGSAVGTYHKHHPIQFFNDGVPGRELPAFATSLGRLGVAICYDVDFASVTRGLVRNGAELLVVPNFDEMTWGVTEHIQHSWMAPARAVEHRRWIVRSASSGISQIIDPYGNVTGSLAVGDEGVVVGSVEAKASFTAYDRVGYVVPYACLAGTVLVLLASVVPPPIGRAKRGGG